MVLTTGGDPTILVSMDSKTLCWRGRDNNWSAILFFAAVAWLLAKIVPFPANPTDGIVWGLTSVLALWVLWLSECRFVLSLDENTLCYSSRTRHEHVSLATVVSVKMRWGRLVVETTNGSHRWCLYGLTADERRNVLVSVQVRLPEPLRAVA